MVPRESSVSDDRIFCIAYNFQLMTQAEAEAEAVGEAEAGLG